MKIADDITALIGGTPLVKLRGISERSGATIVGKLESFNPGGSVKDRIGLSMIDAAEEAGLDLAGQDDHRGADERQHRHRARHGRRRARLPLVLTMPETMSVERRNLLRAYGAELVLTPGAAGHEGRDRPRRRARPGDRGRLRAAAVREPGQPRGAPPHDRRGGLERHRRQGRHLRGRRRHRRHRDRRRRGAQGAQARRADRRRASPRTRRCSAAASPARTRSRAWAPGSSPRCSTRRSTTRSSR